MNGREFTLWAGVGVFLLSVAMGAIPGPNDLRYPDTIVDPRVTCEKEGSFHHPRNCSWYYRCVDRMNIGYYWTYYFECEPGTVFSDELDQCVHPFLAEGPCGTPGPPEPPVCKGVEGTCQTFNICRPQRREKVFCAELSCDGRPSNAPCPAGMMYDMDTKQCGVLPLAQNLCVANETIIITGEDQVNCSDAKRRPYTDLISRLYCDDIVLCDAGQYKGKIELCKNFYECYRESDKWQVSLKSCAAGSLFNYITDSCQPPPTDAERCQF